MVPEKTKYPLSVQAAFLFLGLSALIWFAFSVLALAGAHPALPESRTIQGIFAGLAFGCACALAALIVLLSRRVRSAYFLTTALLALLAALTIADEFGWVDLAYLAVVVVPLILMIRDRDWYLPKVPASKNKE
jgi:lysylphosphatidylglycerol synthetase-like protein (DUF2156 family)